MTIFVELAFFSCSRTILTVKWHYMPRLFVLWSDGPQSKRANGNMIGRIQQAYFVSDDDSGLGEGKLLGSFIILWVIGMYIEVNPKDNRDIPLIMHAEFGLHSTT